MKKLGVLSAFAVYGFALLAEQNPQQIDLFQQHTAYILTNKTDEPMDIDWQSGGGKNNVLTGKTGSLVLAPMISTGSTQKIVTSGSDCLDWIALKSKSTGSVARKESVCTTDLAVQYAPNGKDILLIEYGHST